MSPLLRLATLAAMALTFAFSVSAADASRKCDPAYKGACLRPDVSDYDCAGGSGDGPYYVYGPVRVVGVDHYRLDADGDGWGCERS
jgi:hypothetical protein